MTSIQRILVPVDFSAHSQTALDYALELAKQLGASVDLLHCYQMNLGMISSYAVTIPANFEADLRQAASTQLEDWREKAAAHGVDVEGHLRIASPWEEISERASELESDLIVMGTRGLSGIKHAFLGSVAERVLRTAPCPVLTLRDQSV